MYFPSLSGQTFVYKGMLTTPQLKAFYLDLQDDRLTSALGIVHSRVELRFSSLVPGPDGRPVEGPTEVAPWKLTRPAFDLHAGVRIRATDRVAIRPEVGWRGTSGGMRPDTLEPPLLHLRTMVNVDVRLR